jgi:hypothetical protein
VTSGPAGRPWYVQLWPWVLIGLPAVSVAVSVTALVLALASPDPVVGDDWYKRGLAINRDLDRAAAAARRGIVATVAVDADTRQLSVALDGDADPEALLVGFEHPTLADHDHAYVLPRRAPGRYDAALAGEASGRWYVTIEPRAGDWRLAASLRVGSGAPARLGADATAVR